MCLIVRKDATALIAEEDIICYKILEKKDEDEYITPYRYVAVDMGSKILEAEGEVNIESCKKVGRIEGGVIHTFAFLEEACCEVLASECTVNIWKVFKCIIPKGTKYYEGKFGPTLSYGSTCIKFIEECIIT